MYLAKLKIENIRAITKADLSFSANINIITGVNGSGKTSLLESIFLLGVGRSFRSNQIKTVINKGADQLTVFGKLASPEQPTLGITRDKFGKFKIRINNQDQHKLSSLARHLPVLVITPDSYKLLSSGPQYRRRYLDLSVFHVEPSFSNHWQRYNRVLKQRNAHLKKCNHYSEIAVWDKEFTELSIKIDQARKREFLRLKKQIQQIQGLFLPQYKVQYQYVSGWDTTSTKTLSQQLQKNFENDKRYGYSTIGAHKSDILLTIDGCAIQEVLSRGEQKMLVNAMHLAQAKRLSEGVGKDCLLLIDDLPSELDVDKKQLLLNSIATLKGVQVFITTIIIGDLLSKHFDRERLSISTFHVEQGRVSLIDP